MRSVAPVTAHGSLITDVVVESIADPDVRSKCELAALACGRRLILEADELSIDDVVAAAQSLRATF